MSSGGKVIFFLSKVFLSILEDIVFLNIAINRLPVFLQQLILNISTAPRRMEMRILEIWTFIIRPQLLITMCGYGFLWLFSPSFSKNSALCPRFCE